VTRLHDLCAESDLQKRHLESGPGTHFGAYIRGRVFGRDWWVTFRRARRWFEANSHPHPASAGPLKVFLFGFSRGALIARHFAAWLGKIGVRVAYLGLWDTVDATLGLDVSETCPPNVLSARHAIARDEARRLYSCIHIRPPYADPLKPVEELVFPGSHSDVGGLYADNHVIADAALVWIAEGAQRAGMLIDAKALPAVSASDAKLAVLHDSADEASNLWGVLGRAGRKLKNIRLHPLWAK
jgi:hypothetical protein